MVLHQSRGKDSNSCLNFMKPGSQRATSAKLPEGHGGCPKTVPVLSV